MQVCFFAISFAISYLSNLNIFRHRPYKIFVFNIKLSFLIKFFIIFILLIVKQMITEAKMEYLEIRTISVLTYATHSVSHACHMHLTNVLFLYLAI